MIDVDVTQHATLYAAMSGCSLALMTVIAIAVNLAAALTSGEGLATLASSARPFARASFTAILALLLAAALAIVLLGVDASCGRIVRYTLVGVWAGLVGTASLRGLALGRQILEVSLRTKGRPQDSV